MSTLLPDEIETQNAEVSTPLSVDPTRLETFSKSAAGAKMGGSYHEAAGYIKRKLGRWSADSILEEAGRNQQLLGKVFRLVGSLRGARDAAVEKLACTRNEAQSILREHTGRLLDGTSEFIDELKKTFLM